MNVANFSNLQGVHLLFQFDASVADGEPKRWTTAELNKIKTFIQQCCEQIVPTFLDSEKDLSPINNYINE